MDLIVIDKLIRSARRTISIAIEKDGSLTVRAPIRVSLEDVNNLVQRKCTWIQRKKEQAILSGGALVKKQFVEGEKFLFLGENYTLRLSKCNEVYLDDNAKLLHVPKSTKYAIEQDIVTWYKKIAKDILGRQLEIYSEVIGWRACSMKITSAMTKWGSCNEKNDINFTWRLVMAPMACINYVVVHEITHIGIKNHSRSFWKAVENVLPNYREEEKWLKVNYMLMEL